MPRSGFGTRESDNRLPLLGALGRGSQALFPSARTRVVTLSNVSSAGWVFLATRLVYRSSAIRRRPLGGRRVLILSIQTVLERGRVRRHRSACYDAGMVPDDVAENRPTTVAGAVALARWPLLTAERCLRTVFISLIVGASTRSPDADVPLEFRLRYSRVQDVTGSLNRVPEGS